MFVKDSAMTYSCKACGSTKIPRLFVAKEMMYGLRHAFDYCECSECGSLQILKVPTNLADYYPEDYYSFHQAPPAVRTFRQWAAKQRQEYADGRRNRIGSVLCAVFGPPVVCSMNWPQIVGMRTEDRVLDVGCGSGAMLEQMRKDGFRNLTGIDPYMKTEKRSKGLNLLRLELPHLQGEFDAVMLHHSFEHLPEPLEVLHHIRRVLHPAGKVLIRTPVAGCYAWRNYGAEWFQVDAPRHLFIPSEKGMSIIGKKAGLRLDRVVYDSTYIQFPASEGYQQGIPLREASMHRFSLPDLRAYAARARELNAARDGDQAGFILSRTPPP